MTKHTRSERADDARLVNTSGGDTVVDQLVVLGGRLRAANGIVESGEAGGFDLLPAGQLIEIGSADLKSGEDTFGTANQPVYFDPLTSKVSDTLTDDYILFGVLVFPKGTESSPANGLLVLTVEQRQITAEEASGEFIMGTGVLTAAAAATPVHVIPAAKVAAGKKFYPLGMILSVGGATAWTDSTATVVKLQDTAASPVAAVSVAKAQLTGNAVLGFPSTGVTLQTPVRAGSGMTAAKGIDVVGDANFAAGSDISVTVFGVVK